MMKGIKSVAANASAHLQGIYKGGREFAESISTNSAAAKRTGLKNQAINGINSARKADGRPLLDNAGESIKDKAARLVGGDRASRTMDNVSVSNPLGKSTDNIGPISNPDVDMLRSQTASMSSAADEILNSGGAPQTVTNPDVDALRNSIAGYGDAADSMALPPESFKNPDTIFGKGTADAYNDSFNQMMRENDQNMGSVAEMNNATHQILEDAKPQPISTPKASLSHDPIMRGMGDDAYNIDTPLLNKVNSRGGTGRSKVTQGPLRANGTFFGNAGEHIGVGAKRAKGYANEGIGKAKGYYNGLSSERQGHIKAGAIAGGVVGGGIAISSVNDRRRRY